MATIVPLSGTACADPALRLELPTVVRLGLDAHTVGNALAGGGGAFADMTIGRALSEHLAIEVSFGRDAFLHDAASPGYEMGIMGRYDLAESDDGRHALVFGVGPSLLTGGVYGAVGLLHAELDYELRTQTGFTFLIGGGPIVALNTSRTPPQPDCSSAKAGDLCGLFSPEPYVAGQIGPFLHLSAGWAF